MERRNFFVTEISKLNFNIHTLSLSLSLKQCLQSRKFWSKAFYIYISTISHTFMRKVQRELFFCSQNHSVYDSTQFDTNSTPVNPLYAASLQSPDSITGYSIDSQEGQAQANGYQQWIVRSGVARFTSHSHGISTIIKFNQFEFNFIESEITAWNPRGKRVRNRSILSPPSPPFPPFKQPKTGTNESIERI